MVLQESVLGFLFLVIGFLPYKMCPMIQQVRTNHRQ